MHLVSLIHLTRLFIQYGYLAVFVGLLAEGAGIPSPGETLLLIASALASHPNGLYIGWVSLVAFCTTSARDNIGFYVGRSGGQALLDRYGRKLHIGPGSIQRGRDFISRHGALGVFCARFIAGGRVLNGLVAGSLLMSWPPQRSARGIESEVVGDGLQVLFSEESIDNGCCRVMKRVPNHADKIGDGFEGSSGSVVHSCTVAAW
jgi:hypothetical protein